VNWGKVVEDSLGGLSGIKRKFQVQIGGWGV